MASTSATRRRSSSCALTDAECVERSSVSLLIAHPPTPALRSPARRSVHDRRRVGKRRSYNGRRFGPLAQLVEQGTLNPKVGGSIPPRPIPASRVPDVRVLSVVGNRPQFIKSGPVSVALRVAGIDEVVVHTGQHWDRELSEVFFEELDLPAPAYRLDLHTADPAAMRPGIEAALERERTDWALVYGDTNSTLAGADA